MSNYTIKRDILDNLRDHLSKKEISLITGPRQSGKTTLMKELESFVAESNKNSIWFNLDLDADKDIFENQTKLLQEISTRLGDEGGVIFIDEIQRKESAGLFLKGIYDHVQHKGLDYKFVVSGSGSLELKEKIHESLAGRKLVFHLNTVSFKEFFDFKTDYEYEGDVDKFAGLRTKLFNSLLEEYINFGGYPEVVLADNREEKQRVVQEILKSYLDKDISHLLGVDRIDAFKKMLKLLAVNPGRLVNYDKLASSSGISVPTLKKYLWYAEETFVIQSLSPYFRNKKKEIVKSPKMYFFDLGFMSSLAGNFGNVTNSPSASFFFENLVFNALKRILYFSSKDINFWRTKSGSEVDFVVSSSAGQKLLPIEVKFSEFKEPKAGKSLHSFIQKYEPEKALVVNLSLDKEIKIKGADVRFITFPKFLRELNNFLQ